MLLLHVIILGSAGLVALTTSELYRYWSQRKAMSRERHGQD